MRFVSLKVDSFQTIRHAEIHFIAGLNVIYGANDLGKSTLATALRAALLTVPNSSEAERYASWHSGDAPRVELTFVDAEDRFWRVRKTFASSPSAELLHSKDGLSFTVDCKARVVEERLRAMLAWGIPAPGGKAAPRGAVESFLTNVLLAGQAETDSIFQHSLADDRDESGKVYLSHALSALAQDPLFKEVLAVAQREVDQYFTATGQRKRGQGSRFTKASDLVKQLDSELRDVRRRLDESTAIEGDAKARREACARAAERLHEARHRLAWIEAAGRLHSAEQALDELDAEARRLDDVNVSIAALEERLRELDEQFVEAQSECDRAEVAVRTAEEAHRNAERRKERVDAALAGRNAVIAAQEVEQASAVVAFARLRQALAAAGDANSTRQQAQAALREAESHEATAAELEAQIAAEEGALRNQSAQLVATSELDEIEALQRELEIAEAALGGGITVTVRPSPSVIVRARADGDDDVEIATQRDLQAERTMRLAIADLAEVEILVGSADRRQEVERLRRRWQDVVAPRLAAVDATDVAALRKMLDDVSTAEAHYSEQRRQAARLRDRAHELRERAALIEQRAAATDVPAEELERLRQDLGQYQVTMTEELFAQLGSPSTREAESRRAVLLQQQMNAEKELARVAHVLEQKQYELSDDDPVDLEVTAAALHDAVSAFERAQRQRQSNRDTRDGVRSEHDLRCGMRESLRAGVARQDRPVLAARVETCRREMPPLPAETSSLPLDEESARQEVEAAQREYQNAKEELDRKEGALSQVGGDPLREDIRQLEEARTAAEIGERQLEIDSKAWKLLHDTLRAVENEDGVHLGRALAGPVAARLSELTGGRYGALRLNTDLGTEGIEAMGVSTPDDQVLDGLSVGTRDQLATLLRLTIADQLRRAIVLDDHLVHSDASRLRWFREVLHRTALSAQVIVLTCRPEDYFIAEELPGNLRAIDAAEAIARYGP